jgi:hypothetical protein
MNRKSLLMIALVSLVAGAAVLVYAGAGTRAEERQAPAEPHDFEALPDPVRRLIDEIVFAAQSGDIEKMRPVLESNELKPMVAAAHVDDPIASWKKASADGTGRDVLAALLDVLAVGYVKSGQGQDEMFVWPYFAETDLAKLEPAQEVELYRIVPPETAIPMKKSGKYSYYRLGISPSGVWHYFLK